jgi:uncharacterized membrane protein YkvA (DUF1232 family)
MSEKINRFLALLPDSMKSVVKKHSGMLDSATADYLAAELEDYIKKIRIKAKDNDNIDMLMIENMVTAFKKVIKLFPQLDDAEKRIASSALRYFIDSEDARLDFEDPFGFDDDLAVLNAALIALNLEDIVVQR